MDRRSLYAPLAGVAAVAVAVAVALVAVGPLAVGSPSGGATDPPTRSASGAAIDRPARSASGAAIDRPARSKHVRTARPAIAWRRSVAVGTANAGRLVRGVRLPPEGESFFTWNPVTWTSPNDPERLYGTDRLIRTVLRVARAHRRANPGAPRIAVGDVGLPRGGSFDASHGIVGEFGPGRGTLGHVSHQNGLDVDVYYPRRDRRERGPAAIGDIDRELAQDLVDRFVAAGAQFVFVGPSTGLTGPPAIVQPADRHDDHLHVRLPPG